MTTTALRTEIDYLKIVFMLHVRMSYEMIDFVQKFRQTEQERETVNSMMLMKNDKTQQQLKYELMLNKSAMMKFVLSDRCQQEMMSLYLDEKQTNCTTAAAAAAAAVRAEEKNMNMMLCDKCKKEVVK